MLLFLGSCSKEQIGQTPTVEASRYSLGSISMQLNATSEAFSETNRNEAKAVTFDLGTKGSLTAPKFKELTDGTKLLCIVRSSNAAQPINYIQAVWKREGNRYYIRQSDATYPFEFTAGQDLGTLYMMVVAGGEWDATTKQLKFSNRIAPITTVDGKETATLDVPYFSDWQELEIEDGTPTALKVRLKNYVKGTNETPVFTLKPQGMLIRMRVENEMLDPDNANTFRHIKLNKLYIRSTAYAGSGYYDLSDTQVRAGVSKTAGVRNEQLLPWTFSDAADFKTTELTLATALDLPGDATSTARGSVRGMKDYPNSPWIVAWVKPTGQTVAQVGQNISGSEETVVRTEILADADDVRSNTVYSNKPGVDAEEAAGKTVVPSMKALPVYASRKLVTSTNKAFINGGAYSLTLNLQRMPLLFDRLSEYEVADGGTAFSDNSYSNVAYVSKTEYKNLPLADGTEWKTPTFQELASILGISSAVEGRLGNVKLKEARLRFPTILPAEGNYLPYTGTPTRYLLGFTYKEVDNKLRAFTVLFYPEKSGGDKSARYASIVRYEYDHTKSDGLVVMKMTQRYLGSYSLWVAHFPDNTPSGDYKTYLSKEFSRIVSDDSFWNDALLKKDDIVRYFPLLGMKTEAGTLTEFGTAGYSMMGIENAGGLEGLATYKTDELYHTPSDGKIKNNYKVPIRLIRPTLSFK
jgi:hypothetical protein